MKQRGMLLSLLFSSVALGGLVVGNLDAGTLRCGKKGTDVFIDLVDQAPDCKKETQDDLCKKVIGPDARALSCTI